MGGSVWFPVLGIISIRGKPARGQMWVEQYWTSISLTHWGWVMHICISKLTIIGSGKGLSAGQCQAIIWINAGILLIWTLGTNSSEILSKIHTFSFKKMHLKMSAKWQSICLCLSVLKVLAYLVHNTLFEQIPVIQYLGFGHFDCLFSANKILMGLWLNCILSFEITHFLLAGTLLHYGALFQCQCSISHFRFIM